MAASVVVSFCSAAAASPFAAPVPNPVMTTFFASTFFFKTRTAAFSLLTSFEVSCCVSLNSDTSCSCAIFFELLSLRSDSTVCVNISISDDLAEVIVGEEVVVVVEVVEDVVVILLPSTTMASSSTILSCFPFRSNSISAICLCIPFAT